MIKIQRFTVNPIQENTYVVSDQTQEAVIIDCGAFWPEERQAISNYLSSEGLRPTHLLCTHGHLDHCLGNVGIWKEYGLKPEVMADDEFLITKLDKQARELFGFELKDEIPPVGRFLADGDAISFGTHQLDVISTPGHTPGSCIFWCRDEQTAFTGDTLFHLSIGRTDFERGSYQDMMKSMARLRDTLPPETTLYTGHGPKTLMSTELQANMYLR